MSSMSVSSSSSQSSGVPGVPRVGAVRCYWALLKPKYTPHRDPTITTPRLDLEFVHFDPILDAHLSKQKMSMMGRQVLEFIHPHEREQARKDLTSAISADDLQGSVTRVRFARMSRIRTILGCLPEENEFPEGMDQCFEDDMYIIEDVVLNWVAEGMLLAFFHSIKDKDPVANNDPKRSHEDWSNWCGTKYMADEQIEALYRDVLNKITIPPNTGRPPTRVFQLHLLPPEHSPETPTQLIFSWPPPRAQGSFNTLDGYYNALEYCDMMKHVDMDPTQLTAGPGELRTNCTTRYGAHHLVTTEGLHRTVASVFIPYGKLVFACFQTIREYELPSARRRVEQAQAQGNGSGSGSGGGWGNGGDAPSHTSSPASAHNRPPPLPPPHSAHSTHSAYSTHQTNPHSYPPSHPHHPHHSSHDWPSGSSSSDYNGPNAHASSEWGGHGGHGGYGMMDSGPLGLHGHGYGHGHGHGHGGNGQGQGPAMHNPPSFLGHHHLSSGGHSGYPPHGHAPGPGSGPGHPHGPAQGQGGQVGHGGQGQDLPHLASSAYPTPASATSSYGYYAPTTAAAGEYGSSLASGALNTVHPPPSRPGASGILAGGDASGAGTGVGVGAGSAPSSSKGNKSGPGADGAPGGGGGNGNAKVASRPLVGPQGDIECCVMCGTKESPEWRKGQTGKKDLCNACGLRLARQVAKREGRSKPRKKKDDGGSATPGATTGTKELNGVSGR
ncbi:hypothetical protein IAR50_001646 [Cryptococcus sp. DSM 104548]